MKVIQSYFPVVLFFIQYKVYLAFESADDNLNCDIHLNAIKQYFLS